MILIQVLDFQPLSPFRAGRRIAIRSVTLYRLFLTLPLLSKMPRVLQLHIPPKSLVVNIRLRLVRVFG